MPGETDRASQSVGRAAARALRAMILACKDGAFLGSEPALMQELGVSRSTFRQAARLIEHEQLLTVRRGTGGGFYARRPDPGVVAHAAAIYLQVRKASLSEVVSVIHLLSVEACRLAAACDDIDKRGRLRALADVTCKNLETQQSTRDFHRDELEFMELVAEMSGNQAIELFLRASYQFSHAATPQSIFEGQEEEMRNRRLGRVRTAEAILTSDGEIAALIARRQMEAIMPIMSLNTPQPTCM